MESTANNRQNDDYLFRMNRAIDCIQTNYAKNLNLGKMADVACFSRFHFHRIFRSLMGETASEFLRRVRLEKAAAKLILDQHKSITEIALDCGFSSSQNFARSFKAYYGIPPSIHRSEFNWKTLLRKMRRPEANGINEHYRYHRNLSLKKILDCNTPLPVNVCTLPPFRLAYLRCKAPAEAKDVNPAFEKLFRWAWPREICNPYTLFVGVIWNNPDITPKDKLIYDAGITLPETVKADRHVNIQTLPEGKFAVYRCEVDNGANEEAWVSLIFNWLVSSEYMPDDRPGYEIYYNDPHMHPSKRLILDICMPVRPLDA